VQFRVQAGSPEKYFFQEDFSRKGAKAQRKPFINAAALCAFAGEIFSVEAYFRAKLVQVQALVAR
jgi:hypothetical protein